MLKLLKKFSRNRFDRYYRHQKWRLILDTVLVIIIIFLVIIIFSFKFFKTSIDTEFLSKKLQINLELTPLSEPPLEIVTNISKEIIYFNEELELNLLLNNTSIYDLDKIELDIMLKTENFEISKLELIDSALSEVAVRSNIIYIDKLPGMTEKNIKLKISVTSIKTSLQELSWEIIGSYQVGQQKFTNQIILPKLKFAGDLEAQAAAYYNSPQGDQLGSGPLPPVVGLPTNFWVFFRVDTKYNFNDFIISAKLPANVNFLDNSSLLAGEISYNKETRQLLWRVKKLESNKDNYRAGLELQLVPLASQTGKVVSLLENIKYQAEDSFTSLIVKGNIKSVSTDLEQDLINQGEGKIVNTDLQSGN